MKNSLKSKLDTKTINAKKMGKHEWGYKSQSTFKLDLFPNKKYLYLQLTNFEITRLRSFI